MGVAVEPQIVCCGQAVMFVPNTCGAIFSPYLALQDTGAHAAAEFVRLLIGVRVQLHLVNPIELI